MHHQHKAQPNIVSRDFSWKAQNVLYNFEVAILQAYFFFLFFFFLPLPPPSIGPSPLVVHIKYG